MDKLEEALARLERAVARLEVAASAERPDSFSAWPYWIQISGLVGVRSSAMP